MPIMLRPLSLLIVLCPMADAQTFWNNPAGGNWFDATNWSPMDVPNSADDFSVLPDLGTPYTVMFGTTLTVGPIDLASSATLHIPSSRAARIGSGTMTNDGVISILSGSFSSIGQTVMEGSGTVELGSATSWIGANGTNATLTIGPDITIGGTGYLNTSGTGSSFFLHGTVHADGAEEFVFANGPVDASGGGVFMATNGGRVMVRYTLTGGTLAGGVLLNGGFYNGVLTVNENVVDSYTYFDGSGVTNEGTLEVLGGATLTLRGPATLVNNGTMLIHSDEDDGDGAVVTATLHSSILGQGVIELNAQDRSDDAWLYAGTNTTLTIGQGQTISGRGQVGRNNSNALIELFGLIHADGPGDEIYCYNDFSATDGGLFRATNGGRVVLQYGRLTGGTLDGGVEVSKILDGTRIVNENFVAGIVEVGPLGLVVDGTLTVHPTGGPGTVTLRGDVTTTIEGTGTILLNAGDSPQSATIGVLSGDTLTLAEGLTVRGSGYFDRATGAVIRINCPVIADRAGREILFSSSGVYDATGGGWFEGVDGGTVAIDGTLLGGTLGGGVESVGARVDGVAASGENGIRAGEWMVIQGAGLINNGVFRVNTSGDDQVAYLACHENAAVTGNGIIHLGSIGASAYARLIAYDGSTLTIGEGQTITGNGTLEPEPPSEVRIEGAIAPGSEADPTQALFAHGEIVLGPSAVYRVDVASAASGERDVLGGTADLTLDGTIEIDVIDGYEPAAGERLRVIQVGEINGAFHTVRSSKINGRVFRPVLSGFILEIVWTCAADLNVDGVVDFFDAQRFLGEFASGGAAGDYNEDGLHDFYDVQAFLNDFAGGCE